MDLEAVGVDLDRTEVDLGAFGVDLEVVAVDVEATKDVAAPALPIAYNRTDY